MSGFPEWLPHQRLIEQHVIETVRDVFELHGFAPVETRSVEPLDQLLRKGETDKEIYLLRRLQADADDSDAGLGLHFDLTVPFARYVLENAGRLDFPLRRYQIQKAWRGERPQEGRYREFLQADIDVIDRDTLPFHYEVELPLVIADAMRRLPVPKIRMQVNNRKIPEGFYRGIGIEDFITVLRTVDKIAKVGLAASPHDADRGGLHRGAGRRLRRAGGDLRVRLVLRRRGAQASARQTRCSTRASRSCRGWSTPVASTPPGCWWPTSASPVASTTTPARSTRPSSSAMRASGRSAPAGGMTPSPPTAR